MSMRAYSVQTDEFGCVVFAATRGQAKSLACGKLECEWTEIQTCRLAPHAIAAAKNAMPGLLDKIDALEAERDEWAETVRSELHDNQTVTNCLIRHNNQDNGEDGIYQKLIRQCDRAFAALAAETQRAERAESRARTDREVADNYLGHCNAACAQVDSLEIERDELAAHCERLRAALENLFGASWKFRRGYRIAHENGYQNRDALGVALVDLNPAMDTAESAIAATPAHSLALVKAEALKAQSAIMLNLAKQGAGSYSVAYNSGIADAAILLRREADRLAAGDSGEERNATS